MDDGFESELSHSSSWRVGVSYAIAALCLGVFLAIIIFLGVVLTTRKFTYNIYIVFLLLPDAFLNLIMGIRSIYDGMRENSSDSLEEAFPLPLLLCRFQQIGIGFYISNVYLNAIVTKEVYELVWNSYRRKRTPQPEAKKIVCQALVVYALVSVFVWWMVAPTNWSGVTIENDPYCSASYGSELVPWWVTPLLLMILLMPPIVYCVMVCCNVINRKLLPLKGRTRALALYFLRIIGTFIFFYTPFTIVYVVYVFFPSDNQNSNAYFWLMSIFTILNPIQNIVSIWIFSMKDDIQKAMQQSWKRFSTMNPTTSTTHRMSTTYSGNTNSHSTDCCGAGKQNEWKQDDVYDEEYNSDNDDEDAMSMWRSLPFSLRGGNRLPKTEQMEVSETSDVEDIEAATEAPPKRATWSATTTEMKDTEDNPGNSNAASSSF